MVLDPVSAGVQLIDAWLTRRQIDKWARLLIELVVSYWVTFSSVTGGLLVTHTSFWVALGSGMMLGAVADITLWANSPITKGSQLVAPHVNADDAVKLETLTKK